MIPRAKLCNYIMPFRRELAGGHFPRFFSSMPIPVGVTRISRVNDLGLSGRILILYEPADGEIGGRMQVQNSLGMTSLKDSPGPVEPVSPFLEVYFQLMKNELR